LSSAECSPFRYWYDSLGLQGKKLDLFPLSKKNVKRKELPYIKIKKDRNANGVGHSIG
jgi:hypothetical protein